MATTIKIIEQFNESIKHIQSAYDASKQQDLGTAQNELAKSASLIYQAGEWAIQNILLTRYADKSKYPSQYKIIESHNFHEKLALFDKTISPSPTSLGIDSKIISDLKPLVRNYPEHSGFIPHFNSLVKVVEQIEKVIINYIDLKAILLELPKAFDTELQADINWSEFYDACDNFDKYKNYVLLIGPTEGFATDKLKYLGLLEWSLILDFNSSTEKEGLYKYASEEIKYRKKVHLLTCDDPFSFSPFYSTYWLAANGLEGRSSTITNGFKEWSKKYNAFLNKFINNYIQTFGDKPIDVVILWDESLFVHKVCEMLYNASGEKVRFIYATPDTTKIIGVNAVYEGTIVEISIPKISDGILRIRNLFNAGRLKDSITLPSKEEYVNIDKNDFFWIEESFEIVHRNILDDIDLYIEDKKEREHFYKGKQISWIGLHLHHDIDREKTNTIKKKVERALRERNSEKIFIYHYPGIGGTTISRRIAWDLHNDYPVLILREYKPQDTINKIYKIFDLTKKSPLLITETSVVNIDEIDKLFHEIQSRNFPCVFLVVQRKDIINSGPFSIENILTDLEFNSFISKYKELCPTKGAALDKISKSTEKRERHPFYLGLSAFEENFTGLQNFVERNLNGVTEIQKKAISIIALCYYYAQQPISAQMLSTLLMTPENSVVLLEKHFNNDLLSLLVNEEDIKWRPIHYLVAQELLEQILSGGTENKLLWRQNLPELAISVIKLISDKSSIPSDSDMELLKRLFVYRDSQETLGKEEDSKFSYFMEIGLLSDEARLRVFLELTEAFPDISHFWAHLARFYSLTMKNHEKALESVSKAIELSTGKDSLLYHMRGMCLRTKARDLMSNWRGDKTCPIEVVNEIRRIVDESGEDFEECRTINPYNEHGFISHIQLLINVIDFSFSISNYKTKVDFLRNLDLWLQEKLDLAEELLDRIKLQTQMKDHNTFVEQCDLHIQELYENFSQVIEGWYNQLTTSSTPKPVIRRSLVRAYVRKANSWDKVERKDLERILKLIEENIQEEPNKGSNIYLWFQAARQLDNIDINAAIDKVSNWRTISDVDESIYYLAILHTIQAIEGTSVSKIKAEQIIRELSEKKRTSPYRTHCFEWLGKKRGLKKLVPYKLAVTRDDSNEFVFDKEPLERVIGKISFIKGPEAGNIEWQLCTIDTLACLLYSVDKTHGLSTILN